MSYLLTEIALEMLGYKFYDTNGVYHLTNFQLTTPQTDLHPNEKTLQTLLLGEEEDAESEPGPSSSTTPADNEHPDGCNINATDEATGAPQSTEEAFRKSQELASLLEIECNKVKTEIKQRMCSNYNKTKKGQPIDMSIKDFMRVVEEAQMIKQFREFVEHRMIKIDPLAFAKYARTFGVTELPAVEIEQEALPEGNDPI